MQQRKPEHRAKAIAVALLVSAIVAIPTGAETDEDAATAYDEAINSGLYAEAETAAKALLDRAIRDGRHEELSTAALFNDLARAQRLNRNYDAALQNYRLAISLVEGKLDNLDLALAEPLLGIGYTYLARDRPDLALPQLERALHVRHVNQGPHNLAQAETLETLIDAYRLLGEVTDAVEAADRLVLLYGRNFPGKSMEVVPALLRKGQIYGDARNWREERNTYNEAIEIIEHNEGKSSSNLARPLIQFGKSHHSEYFHLFYKATAEEELPDPRLLNEAESYLESALKAARKDANVDWRILNESLLALGDFYTLIEEPGRARLMYRDAWQLLTKDAERRTLRGAVLEAPVPLLQPPPDLGAELSFDAEGNPEDSAWDTGHIVTQFTITRRGRLADIGLVEMNPERNERIEARIKHALSHHVYRPRFENGFVVDTPGQTIRYEFAYPKSDDPAD